MSRKRPDGQPTAVLIHPNDPDIKFTVRKATRQEWQARRVIRAQRQIPVTVPDAEGKPLLGDDGKPVVVFRDMTSFSDLVDDLKMIVTNVDGVGLSFADALPELMEEWLDIKFDPPIKEDGKIVKSMDAASWIWREVVKPETFDADPLGTRSASQ